MDWTAILAAVISALAAIVVCVISNHYQNENTRNLLEYRLTQLEEKVDKHNNLVERTYKLEQHNEVQDEKIKEANHRIEDLEKR
jgi:hypothetical protein|nr:MAG TPA_asm: hemolysin XhlA [Caudoviricetes sp.]